MSKAFRLKLQDWGLLAALVALVAALSLLPLGRLLFEALAPGGTPSIATFEKVFSNPVTWRATGHSLEISIGGTILATAIGVVVALLVGLGDIRCRNAFVFCFVLPLMIAPQVTALAWLQVAGPSSPLLRAIGLAPAIGTPNPLYSREGIILLLGIEYAPLVFLTLRAGLRRLPRELIEAALAAGARKGRVLRTVVLPLMTPPLVAGIALTFVSCVGNFGIPAFLGIPGGYIALPTLIYQRLSGLGPAALAEVSGLSVLAGLIAVAGILLQNYMLGRRDYRITGNSLSAAPFELGRWRLPVEAMLWGYLSLVLVVPFASLLAISLVPIFGVPLTWASASIENYVYVLIDYPVSHRAFRNSLLLAASAAAIIVAVSAPLGYYLAWRGSRALKVLNLSAEMPYALPGIVFAIALILVFLKPIPVLNLSIYNTVWIIFVAYLGRFLVLGLRPVISGYHQIDRSLEEAASALGAGVLRRMRTIMFPLVAHAAAAGALLVFLMAFSELTLSALLWSSGAETLGTVMFSFQQSGGVNYASAIAVVTILVTLVLMLSTLLLGQRLPKGVLPWQD
ncbi:MAG: iron ABC transporter permease [Rhodospirillales bacterium]|nr:iron ABC transporter permease [Rhodospirillales bacterium]